MSRIIVPEKESQAYVSKLFQTIGAEKKHADVVADHLTMAEMRGQASHGLNRIPFYTQKLEHGGYKSQSSHENPAGRCRCGAFRCR